MQRAALYTSGIIFAVGAVARGVRLTMGFEIVVGGVVVPIWVSLPGVFIAALLAVWMAVAALVGGPTPRLCGVFGTTGVAEGSLRAWHFQWRFANLPTRGYC